MIAQTLVLVKSLVEQFPRLKPILDEHIEDNGEVLPHVFFGELTRHLLSLFSATHRDTVFTVNTQDVEVYNIFEYIENAFVHGDDDIKELIVVSFLENLPRLGEAGDSIREMIGPTIGKQLRDFDWD